MVTPIQAITEGLGIYSLSEAARYARMPTATLNRWFFGVGGKKAMRESGIEQGLEKAITFVDFVETLAVRALRADHGVSLQTIREAIQTAQDQYQIEHPFARKDHKTVIVGKELHIIFEGAKDPIGLTGKDKGQKSFKTCIEAYMKDLEFNQEGLAKLYRIYCYRNQEIVLNPAFMGGAPVLKDHGFTAETLWRAAVAEGSIAKAADVYEVPEDAVEAAYRYCNTELGMAA